MTSPTYRIGVDIGGTFTDLVLLDEGGGRLEVLKVPSTPADPAAAVLTGTRVSWAGPGWPPTASASSSTAPPWPSTPSSSGPASRWGSW